MTYRFAIGESGGEWDVGLTTEQREDCKEEVQDQVLQECCPCETWSAVSGAGLRDAVDQWLQATGNKFEVDLDPPAARQCCMCINECWHDCHEMPLSRRGDAGFEPWIVRPSSCPGVEVPILLRVECICPGHGRPQPTRDVEVLRESVLTRATTADAGTLKAILRVLDGSGPRRGTRGQGKGGPDKQGGSRDRSEQEEGR